LDMDLLNVGFTALIFLVWKDGKTDINERG